MKTKILTSTLMFIAILAFGQIPNPSFEQWTGSKPNGWHSYFDGAPYTFETQDNNPYQGSYAIRSSIVQTGPVANVAGIVTGDVTWTGYNPTMNQYGFIPTTAKPTKLFGWYILHNNNLDTMTANVWFKNSGNVIGTGEFKTTASNTIYTQFIVNINYTSSLQPDSFKIFITFNHRTPSSFNNAGAYFIIDSLRFDNTVGINENNRTENSVKIYPNPTNALLMFQTFDNSAKIKIAEIYNSNGQLVDKLNPNETSFSIDIEKYKSGLYSYKLTFDNETVKTGRIVKK